MIQIIQEIHLHLQFLTFKFVIDIITVINNKIYAVSLINTELNLITLHILLFKKEI